MFFFRRYPIYAVFQKSRERDNNFFAFIMPSSLMLDVMKVETECVQLCCTVVNGKPPKWDSGVLIVSQRESVKTRNNGRFGLLFSPRARVRSTFFHVPFSTKLELISLIQYHTSRVLHYIFC